MPTCVSRQDCLQERSHGRAFLDQDFRHDVDQINA